MLGWRGRLRFRVYNPEKLQSTAYWYRWFVKVQLDIFVTCTFTWPVQEVRAVG